MKNLKEKVQQLKIQAVRLLEALDRPFLLIAILLILLSGYLVEPFSIKIHLPLFGDILLVGGVTDVMDRWDTMLNLYRLAFLLLVQVARKSLMKIMYNLPHRIIFWLLLNHFYDRMHGETGWSVNDTLTVIMILLEVFFQRKLNILPNKK